MKIIQLETINFMGLEGRHVFTFDNICALMDENGKGKTSLINALRYALTGQKPNCDIIHKKYSEAKVLLTLENEATKETNVYEREERRDKPNRCRINGKGATTMTSLNEAIEDDIGISLEAIKLISSSELIASMRPQEFSSFLLEYIPEDITLEKVISYIPNTTLGMVDILEKEFTKDKFGIADIDSAEAKFREIRKNIKKELSQKESLRDTLSQNAPVRTMKDVEEELINLSNIEKAYDIYKIEQRAYEQSLNAYKKHSALLEETKKRADLIKAERPNENKRDELLKNEAILRDSLMNASIVLNSMENSLNDFKTTLKNLESSFCPLSDKIVCSTDKTKIKNDVLKSIQTVEAGILTQKGEINKMNSLLSQTSASIKEINECISLYEKKKVLLQQIACLEKSFPIVPEKPVEVAFVDVSVKKATLNNELLYIKKYDEYITIVREIETLTNELKDYDALVKALELKGVVRNTIMEYYLSTFEEVCNKKASQLKPDLHFTFVNEDGVKVLMDSDKAKALPYESLSGGEKAYMLFILMDMLNQLTGSHLLLLDELSVLDAKTFKSLLQILVDNKNNYDHIILAAVNHDDLLSSVNDFKIPILSLK